MNALNKNIVVDVVDVIIIVTICLKMTRRQQAGEIFLSLWLATFHTKATSSKLNDSPATLPLTS